MKMTLTTWQIADALHSDENANWSHAGSQALAEWLEDYEDSTGEELELDVVAIRCDFSEFKSLQAWAVEYFGNAEQATVAMGLEIDYALPSKRAGGCCSPSDEDELDEAIHDHITDNGQLIEFSGGIIVSNF